MYIYNDLQTQKEKSIPIFKSKRSRCDFLLVISTESVRSLRQTIMIIMSAVCLQLIKRWRSTLLISAKGPSAHELYLVFEYMPRCASLVCDQTKTTFTLLRRNVGFCPRKLPERRSASSKRGGSCIYTIVYTFSL